MLGKPTSPGIGHWAMAVSAATACLGALLPCGAAPLGGTPGDAPAANVNGETILAGDLMREIQERYALQTLEQMIFEAEISRQAERLGLTVSDAEWRREAMERWSTAENPIDTDAKLDEQLRHVPAWVVSDLRNELLLAKILNASVKATDAEVRELYDSGVIASTKGTAVKLRRILFKREADARGMRPSLRASNFAEFARQVSEDEFRDQGGDWGWHTLSSLPDDPELRKFAETAEIGVPSQPLRLKEPPGWVILLVEERRTDAPLPYDEVRGQLETLVLDRKKDEMLRGWRARVRSLAAIVALDKAFRSVVPVPSPRTLPADPVAPAAPEAPQPAEGVGAPPPAGGGG